jgi:PEP-CTERM motif
VRMRLVCFVATALLAGGGSARADNVETFDVSGTFTDSTTVSGTVVVDTTTGVFESGNLTYLGTDYDVLYDAASLPSSGAYQFVLTTGSGLNPSLDFALVGSSLVGFDGGPLCSVTDVCGIYASAYEPGAGALLLESGTVSATPEPSSLMLVGTGLLGSAGVVRRRLSQQRKVDERAPRMRGLCLA